MKARTIAIAAATAGAMVLSAGPGMAAEQGAGASVRDVEVALDVSAPDLGPVAGLTSAAGGGLQAVTSTGSDVTVSRVTVRLADATGAELDILLPDGLAVSAPEVTASGDAVFPALTDDSASAVVRVLDSGAVSVQTVLHSADAPRAYSYSFGGELSPTVREDGGVDLVNQSGVVEGAIEAPWAYDAEGNAVPTHYQVEGEVVTQVIEADAGAVFPIVADPTFGHTYGIPTLYLNKAETKSSRDTSKAQAICGVGGLLNAVLAAFCAGNAYIISEGAKTAYNQGKCAKVALGPVVAGLAYPGGNCK